MNDLNVKNLIIYHTEDSHGNERKKLYTEEAKKYFKGNVIVPNDLDIIDFESNKTSDSEDKKRILVTGTVLTASEESINTYKKILSFLDNTKYQVSTPLDTIQFSGNDLAKYQRAMDLLQNTDFMIAEMSQVSTGQGMEIQEAARLNIPVLVIAKTGSKISSLVKGCQNIKNIIYYDDIDEMKDTILEFIEGAE